MYTFYSLDCTSQAWIKFQTLPQYVMLRRHTVLLIAIRPSDGDVKPGGPLGAFREEHAMSQHRVSPSPFLSSSSSSHTLKLHYTDSYTYSHPNLNFLQYTIQILVPHVMWSAQAVRSAIYPLCADPKAHNSAVGWHWNTPLAIKILKACRKSEGKIVE